MNRYIQFTNVGRRKFSGRKLLHPEITTPNDIAAVAYDEAIKHLMSVDVNTTYNSEKNEGLVTAGFHIVGRFTIVNKKETRNDKKNNTTEPC